LIAVLAHRYLAIILVKKNKKIMPPIVLTCLLKFKINAAVSRVIFFTSYSPSVLLTQQTITNYLNRFWDGWTEKNLG
jgi:hypothetical protein